MQSSLSFIFILYFWNILNSIVFLLVYLVVKLQYHPENIIYIHREVVLVQKYQKADFCNQSGYGTQNGMLDIYFRTSSSTK